ncbi:hypothetical protein ACFL96_00510 [Thermoproteota archaeon]
METWISFTAIAISLSTLLYTIGINIWQKRRVLCYQVVDQRLQRALPEERVNNDRKIMIWNDGGSNITIIDHYLRNQKYIHARTTPEANCGLSRIQTHLPITLEPSRGIGLYFVNKNKEGKRVERISMYKNNKQEFIDFDFSEKAGAKFHFLIGFMEDKLTVDLNDHSIYEVRRWWNSFWKYDSRPSKKKYNTKGKYKYD